MDLSLFLDETGNDNFKKKYVAEEYKKETYSVLEILVYAFNATSVFLAMKRRIFRLLRMIRKVSSLTK